MSTPEQLLDELSRIPDTAYFARDETPGRAIASAMLDASFHGLLLGAPRTVDTKAVQKLPAMLISARTADRSDDIPLHENAFVVAVDLESGTVTVSSAFPGNASKSPGPEPRTTRSGERATGGHARPTPRHADDGDGDSAGTAWLDLRALLNPPWKQGRFAFWAVYFDEVSNRAVVTLEGNADAGTPARTRGIPPARGTIARETSSGGDYPSFERRTETPALIEPGATLAMPSRTVGIGATPWPVYGAVRLPVTDAMIVRPISDGARPETGADRGPSVFIPAMLLVAMKGRDIPSRLPLAIPVRTGDTPQPGDVLEGVFAVDLAASMPTEPPPGDYQMYLVAGGFLSGPVAFGVVPAR